MTKPFTKLILLLFFWSSTSAQPNIQWQKSFGGSDNDLAFDIQLTNDGGYIVVGGSFSNDIDVSNNHGGEDYWLIKLDSIGNIQWEKSLGGLYDDEPYSIIQTLDSGYIVVGTSRSNDGDVTGHHGCLQSCDDYWVIKLNYSGNIQWQKSYGGSNFDMALSVIQLPDKNYIVSGTASSVDGDVIGLIGGSDAWILKLVTLGNIIWQRIFGRAESEKAYSIKQTTDQGFIIAGNTWSVTTPGFHGTWGNDYWVLKLDSLGIFQWQKCLGGFNFDESNSVEVISNNGYIISGFVQSNSGDVTNQNGGSDFWIVKLDPTGSIVWQKAFGGTNNENAYSLSKTMDGGFVVAGMSGSSDGMVTGHHGDADYWVIKIDSLGNLQWQKSLGGTGADEGRSIKQTPDGGYIIAGSTFSNDGDVMQNKGLSDYWVIKLFPDAITNISNPNNQPILSISPNPFSSNINITFQKVNLKKVTLIVHNTIGQIILIKQKSNLVGICTEALDLSFLSNGIYFLEVLIDGVRTMKKIVKE